MLTVEQLWQPVPGGSGSYVAELARALAERRDVRVQGLAACHRDLGPGPGPRVPVRHVPVPRRVLYPLWSASRGPLPGALGAGKRPDVLHATTWAIPPRVAPLVVTVHDLAFLRDPGHFTRHGSRYFRRALRITRAEADLVVVPSEATARDCSDQGIEPDRIMVIPHGVRIPTVGPAQISAFRRAHRLDRPYVLWTGTLEPRKNLAALLAGHTIVREQRSDLDLVLVGPTGWGRTTREVEAALAATAGRVHWLGRLSAGDLHRAYAGATVFCYPSL